MCIGCRLILVRRCDSDFGITPVDDITIGERLSCLLFPHSTYFIRQFLVLVLFVGYCFGEIMRILDSYVYQICVLCFLFRTSYVRSIKIYCFVRKYALMPVQLIIIIIIIIIIINCNWVVTLWQWLFYMFTKYEIGYY